MEAAELRRINLEVLQDLLRSGESITAGSGFYVAVAGYSRPVALKFMAWPQAGPHTRPIVFCFHGAIDREKRNVPVFDGRYLRRLNENDALVISLADPLLEAHESLRTTWYAGSDALDTPTLLRTLISALRETIQPTRTIFVASSTGGHAALVQAWHVPDSVCVVSNPIVRISAYHRSHLSEYRSACWPRLAANSSWPKCFVDSVATLYAQRCECNVIYLNNARDHHFWLQAAEFMHEVRQGPVRGRLLFLSYYHPDYAGHATSPAVMAGWVSAACGAPGESVEQIAQYAYEQKTKIKNPASLGNGRSQTTPTSYCTTFSGPSADDLAIARKIFDSLQ